jgi:hypothetical protein
VEVLSQASLSAAIVASFTSSADWELYPFMWAFFLGTGRNWQELYLERKEVVVEVY